MDKYPLLTAALIVSALILAPTVFAVHIILAGFFP